MFGYNLYTSAQQIVIRPDDLAAESLVIERQTGRLSTSPRPNLTGPPQRIYGIVGIVQLKLDRYLIAITGRRSAGRIGRDEVYEISSTTILPLRLANLKTVDDPEEQGYIRLIRNHLNTGPFYFSYSLDLTNTAQRRDKTDKSAKPALWQRADERFYWNRYAQQDLIAERERTGNTKLDAYILPLMYGFLEIRSVAIKGKRMTFALITRRSRHRAGTRYFSRGIDDSGNVSNFNETEQLVLLDPSSNSGLIDGDVKLSYVQTRGSVPAYWAEVNDLKYKPRMRIFSSKDATSVAKRHFEQQLNIYGKQYCINLVNQKGHELPVKQAYEDVVRKIALPGVEYVYFDFHHECRNMRWHRVQILIDQLDARLKEQGYYHSDASKGVIREQTSVCRTNCMDCLDRTNVVQSALARWTLSRQLQAVGVLAEGQSTAEFVDFELVFRNLWADNANTVSLSYSGTGALKTDFTRTGKRSKQGALQDGINSLVRYVKNNYLDGPRQDAYDLFLGVYRPADSFENPFGEFRPVSVQAIPYVAWSAFLMILAALILPRSPNAWGSMKVFVLFWLVVLGASVQYLLAHGLWYVNWPQLRAPDFLSQEKGVRGINVRGFVDRAAVPGKSAADMEAGKARRD
ncbi:Phosphoinositide phosphatase sac1 [Savitreella phatthalungensis]